MFCLDIRETGNQNSSISPYVYGESHTHQVCDHHDHRGPGVPPVPLLHLLLVAPHPSDPIAPSSPSSSSSVAGREAPSRGAQRGGGAATAAVGLEKEKRVLIFKSLLFSKEAKIFLRKAVAFPEQAACEREKGCSLKSLSPLGGKSKFPSGPPPPLFH